MITIQGKGVSKGIAKGPLYFFQRSDTTVTLKVVSDIEAEKARLAVAQEPVSYTHLDVYKRQPLYPLLTACRETRLHITQQPGFWHIRRRKCGKSRDGAGRSTSMLPAFSGSWQQT